MRVGQNVYTVDFFGHLSLLCYCEEAEGEHGNPLGKTGDRFVALAMTVIYLSVDYRRLFRGIYPE